MSDYTNVPIIATGDWIDAAFINQYWGDNFRAVWPYTTTGDEAYALDGNTLARLGIGATWMLKRSTGSAPEWSTLATILQNTGMVGSQVAGDLFYASGAAAIARKAIGSTGQNLVVAGGVPVWDEPDVIHAYANVSNYGSQNTTSTSPVDVTGMSTNLTLSRACKILVFGSAAGQSSNASYPIIFNLSIDGTVVGDFRSYSPYVSGIGIGAIQSGVAAGSRNVKLQFKSPFGVDVATFGGFMAVVAVPN